ncbi:hypothetical protein GO001_22230 [Streptomyces sp. NRRL B-1677]|uniref:hypothetical protein n=1 Tax=Streptomyces TaxID=1883 RepID=UPI0011C47279|nr:MULTISPECIES: hypothetical protein [Streptomyces]MBF6047916.1 hypothetical protein [Streptomyces sp. NRRL B-1677]
MPSPRSRPTKVSRAIKTAATTLMALTALATSAPASVPASTIQHKAAETLRCRLHTVPGHPITFTPKLTLQPRTTKVSGSLKLTDCTSPDGKYAQLRTGSGEASGTGQASCGGASGINGSAAITWYDRSGRSLGTSTLKPTLRSVNSYNPADSFLAGEVTRGPLAHLHAAGSITPTSDVTACTSSGLRSLHGTGTLRFLR